MPWGWMAAGIPAGIIIACVVYYIDIWLRHVAY